LPNLSIDFFTAVLCNTTDLFYKSAAEKVADKSLKALFEGFAKDEAGHKVLLEGYLTGAEKALQFDAAHDYKVSLQWTSLNCPLQ